MTITFTDPVIPPTITSRRVFALHIDVVERRATYHFQTGYIDGAGEFVSAATGVRIFTDETNPTFADFVSGVGGMGQLRRNLELYEAALDRPGTVS